MTQLKLKSPTCLLLLLLVALDSLYLVSSLKGMLREYSLFDSMLRSFAGLLGLSFFEKYLDFGGTDGMEQCQGKSKVVHPYI